jgi:hypothetical protein
VLEDWEVCARRLGGVCQKIGRCVPEDWEVCASWGPAGMRSHVTIDVVEKESHEQRCQTLGHRELPMRLRLHTYSAHIEYTPLHILPLTTTLLLPHYYYHSNTTRQMAQLVRGVSGLAFSM